MRRTNVESSQIHSVGYDPETLILEVAFRTKSPDQVSVYQYDDVSEDVYDAFMASSSKGKFLHAHIKNGGYPFRKIGTEDFKKPGTVPSALDASLDSEVESQEGDDTGTE